MLVLEKLPNLRILGLKMDSFVGKVMVCSDKGFPQLKCPSLCDMGNVEEWKVEEGGMLNLCRLEISNSTSMKMVPDGLEFLRSLEKIEIISMFKAFKNRVENGREDYHKVKHVPSVMFWYCDY